MIASPPDAAGIVLDPAHGGRRDTGGSPANVARGVGGTLGKDLVLDLCRRTRIRLEARGVPVRLTRDGDVNRTLAQRGATARHPAAGVFVSLHAAPAGGRTGLRTWVHRADTVLHGVFADGFATGDLEYWSSTEP